MSYFRRNFEKLLPWSISQQRDVKRSKEEENEKWSGMRVTFLGRFNQESLDKGRRKQNDEIRVSAIYNVDNLVDDSNSKQ